LYIVVMKSIGMFGNVPIDWKQILIYCFDYGNIRVEVLFGRGDF
jgi:hypothetical protein